MRDKELAFSVAEFEGRLEKVCQRLRERNVAGMLIHTPENIYYLSGYQTPGYYARVHRDVVLSTETEAPCGGLSSVGRYNASSRPATEIAGRDRRCSASATACRPWRTASSTTHPRSPRAPSSGRESSLT
jgi:Xaa-Pro aminopeptidase